MARLPRNEIQIFIPKDENSSRGKIFNFEAFSSKMLKLNNSNLRLESWMTSKVTFGFPKKEKPPLAKSNAP